MGGVNVRRIVTLCITGLCIACSADAPQPGAAADRNGLAPVVDSPGNARDTMAQNGDVVQTGSDVLTADGWGPLRIGMSRAEVVAAAGEDANPGAVGGPNPAECDEFRPERAPAGMLVMIEDGRLVRITAIRNAAITTPAGLRIGDTAAAVMSTFGTQAQVTPHKYVAAPAKYITVWSGQAGGNDRRGILYEIDTNERITAIHGGGPSIEYVEGCA